MALDVVELPDVGATSDDRRRFRRSAAVGVLLGALVVAWVSTAGSFDLLRWHPISDFYDEQAEAWLDGRWDIGVDTLGVESFFRFDDDVAARVEQGWPLDDDPLVNEEILRSQRAYMYQGPVPALARLPTAALAPDLSGRLTAASILLGTATAGWVSGHILWEARRRLRQHVPVTRGEAVGVAAWCALVTGGSLVLYLAAQPWVYHEAAVWGVALCLASLLAMIRYLAEPTTARLVALGLLVTACLSTRASVGLGPLLGVAVVGGAQIALVIDRRRGDDDPPSRAARAVRGVARWAPAPHDGSPLRRVVELAAVGVVAIGAYALVNHIKFGSPFSVPFDHQLHTIIDPSRQEFLAVNGGFFSPRFIPTTLLQYLRPDAISLSSLFPWTDVGPVPVPILFGARVDDVDPTSSVPVTLPAFVLLAGLAAVASLRRWVDVAALRAFRIPLIGAAGSGLTILVFGYIANRYMADVVPVVVLAAAIGLQVLMTALDRHPRGDRPRWLRAGLGLVVAAGLVGAWTNLSQGLVDQRVRGLTTDEERTAAFVGTQSRVEDLLGTDVLPGRLHVGEELPVGAAGDLFVVGGCEALYLHDGNPPTVLRPHSWIPVERTEEAGRVVLALRFAANEPGTRVPIMSGASDAGSVLLVAETTEDGRVVFESSGVGIPHRSAPADVDRDHTYEAVLVADPHLSELSLTLDGRRVVNTHLAFAGPVTIGRDLTGAEPLDRFDGTIERRPGTDASVCRELVARAGGGVAALSARVDHRIGSEREEVLVGEEVRQEPHAGTVDPPDEPDQG